MAGKWNLFFIKLQSFLSQVYQYSTSIKSSQKQVGASRTLPLMITMLLCSLGQSISAKAQLIPDKTLGSENSVIKPFDSLNDLIDGGARRGVNLFHSFQEFNVDAGRSVYFLNPGVNNIITRVTGGNSSKIFGILGAYSNANLFLINPNGILFGSNARLALGGSFVASTASGVVFDGFEFSSVDPKEVPLLTANIPIGLRFRDNPGAIRVENSRLEVRPEIQNIYDPNPIVRGTTLALVGGNIDLDGSGLIAQVGSQVELGGLTNAGTVGINSDNNGTRLSFPNGIERADVSLTNGAFILTNGVKLEDSFEEGSKVIDSIIDVRVPSRLTINSRNINIENGSQLINIGVPLTPPFSLPKADININATGSVVINESLVSNNSGGDTNIRAKTFSLLNGSELSMQVDATAYFAPTNTSNLFDQDVRTGNITLQVDDKIFLSNSSVATSLKTTRPTSNFLQPAPTRVIIDLPLPKLGFSLPGANIKIPDPSPFTSRITANIAETTGNIIPPKVVEPETNGRAVIRTGQNISNFSDIKTQANAGGINIKGKTLSLTDTAQLFINSETSFNQTAALGNINIDINDAVTINGKNSGVFASIGKSNQVITAGNINLKSGLLSLTDGAQLQTSIIGSAGLQKAGSINIDASDSVSLENSRISSIVQGGGNNIGDITLNANSITLHGSTIFAGIAESQGSAGTQAGDIILNAVGKIAVGRKSFIENSVGSFSIGNGGDIKIRAGIFSLTDDARLVTSTSGQGNAGDIYIQANGSVSLETGAFMSNVESGGVGNGGDINIEANSFSMTDGGALQTVLRESTNGFLGGRGKAGNVNIVVQNDVSISGVNDRGFISAIFTEVNPGTIGNGGDINITAKSFSLTDGARLLARTQGQGDAGNIHIKATDSATVSGVNNISGASGGLITNTNTGGKGGNITVEANKFSVKNGAVLDTRTNANGNGGNITVNTNTFEAADGGQLIAVTSGSGSAGNIIVNATKGIVNIFGSDANFNNQMNQVSKVTGINEGSVSDVSGLFTTTNAGGKGGNITVNTTAFRIADKAVLNARTNTSVDGGQITVNASEFEAVSGGLITTTTTSGGRAGSIAVNVMDSIKLQGRGSGLFANTDLGSTGKGGNIFVDPRFVLIQDGAGIAVNSQGSGEAGDITLIAGDLTLDNRAFISAETASNQGGDINLQIQDLLLLRRESRISTTAGTEGGPGSGGNMNIGSKFVVAVPNENSDITANSFGGSGGRINVNTERVFGFQVQNELTDKSDVTAFSQSDASLNGQVVFSPFLADPSQGLVELPQNVINPEDQIAQNPCQQRVTNNQSEFFNVGRGGLPANPTQTLSSDSVRVGWVEPDKTSNFSQKEPRGQTEASPIINQTQAPIMPARGWVRNEKGEVILVSYNTNNQSAELSRAKDTTCPAP